MSNLIECEDHILKKMFDCLVTHGLERTSIRDLCDCTGLSTSSIYYRFNNRDEMVLESAYFGLINITKELFWAAVIKINNFSELFQVILSNVESRKRHIRFIYQVAASPRYGDSFRKKTLHISEIYKSYIEMLANQLDCEEQRLEPYVNLFIAVIREYVLWENKLHTENELHYIYDQLVSTAQSKV